jgi:polysaccharide export outer membrane protein
VIVAGSEKKEEVSVFPCTGNETVIDAIAGVTGRVLQSANLHVARQGTDGGQWQVFPIDWAGITKHGDTRTNYQILPGDRVYVRTKE